MPSSVPQPDFVGPDRAPSHVGNARLQSPATGAALFEPPATIADSQTLADRDQGIACIDQAPTDCHQTADSDRASSERDLARDGDHAEHDFTRDVRERREQQREQAAEIRVATAAYRDAVANARDLAAMARDHSAALRDRELSARDAVWASNGHPVSGAEVLLRAGEYRRLAASDRLAALEGRVRAAAEREQAAREREQAARDRAQAKIDRDALLQQLTFVETDQLTGTRTAGFAHLEREIDRACRMSGLLVTAYEDVVCLEPVDKIYGDDAGDDLLQDAAPAIRDHLRSYDLVVRVVAMEHPGFGSRGPSDG